MTDDPGQSRANHQPAPAASEPSEPSAETDETEVAPPHDALGAYVLDALPMDERRDFESHLATSTDCRQAVAELAPVVAVLPRLYDREPAATVASREAIPVPAADLRERIVTAAQRVGPPTVATGPGADRTAGRAAGRSRLRPRRRWSAWGLIPGSVTAGRSPRRWRWSPWAVLFGL